MATERLDAIILGSGQAGNPLARALAQAGKKTAIIESRHVGGTCINEGCTPTKTMVASARVAYLARRGANYGVKTGDISVDMLRVRERKRAIVASFRDGSEKRLKSTENLELIFGEASFSGAKTVEIRLRAGGERMLSADLIFVNTGSRAQVPKIDGIDRVPYLDNVSVMELDHIPEHLLVLGGGYIGLEFGQIFRRLGAQVTVIHSGSQLLKTEDEDIAEEVRKILTEEGMEVALSSSARRVEQTPSGISVTVSGQEGEREIKGSHLLVATGRRPNTDALNLGAAGIESDKQGYIRVNEYLETTVPGIYALGDVKGGPAFTHISYDDYRIAAGNVLGGKRRSISGRMVPYTLFTDPQLGRIGLTEQQARAQGKKIKVAKMPADYIARALETDETRGVLKVIVEEDSGQILGAAALLTEGGEVASMLQIAMMGKLPFSALRDGTFSHPTWSEALNNVFQGL